MTKDVEKTEQSFLSRWARRKTDAQAEVKFKEAAPAPAESTNTNTGVPFEAKMLESSQPERSLLDGDDETEPAHTSANAQLPAIETLTSESDFTPFMGKDVAADMRNQAMKKLFTDPHYNLMDGLDIYIDDYTKSDPIPLEMLRKMTQSKALFLFEEEEKAEAEAEAAAALAATEATGDDLAISEAVVPTRVPPAQPVDGFASEKARFEISQAVPTAVIDASIKSA